LELFSLKEKVTLLPGGLFVCGMKEELVTTFESATIFVLIFSCA
jgi:hypothetical protein